jgi:hypothetical protein
MPQGSKAKYSSKQKRQAEHIEEGYEKKGLGRKTAEARAWATVNKISGRWKKERVRQKTPGHGLNLAAGLPSRPPDGLTRGRPRGTMAPS